MAKQQIYHGLWYVPDGVPRFAATERMGTLTIEKDGSAKLEIYVVQRKTPSFKAHCDYDVIWGDTADGIRVSLFGASLVWDTNRPEVFCSTYTIKKVVLGEHLMTGDEPVFDYCVTQYRYLRNWAYDPSSHPVNLIVSTDYRCNNIPLLNFELEKGVRLKIDQHYDVRDSVYEKIFIQTSIITFLANKPMSINHYMDLIGKFSQFLSFALFSRQLPYDIMVLNNNDNHYNKVFYKVEESHNPDRYSLIPFNVLRAKLPLVLQAWYKHYDQLSQICKYLLTTLQYDEFDEPDFLIIAQALDGFHKRFRNPRNGKNVQKFKDEIDLMLKDYNDITSVKRCHINSAILKDSRDKYTHLIPDCEDKETVVRGHELFRLTQKAKVLLTCCILDLLGLTHEEIDLCFNSSVFKSVIDDIDSEDGF